jgi:phosphoribosylformimino-5-aminoimidazole carboxamide ribotide isomerase
MIELIPAIDLIDGKCVRLSQGDFAQRSVYSDDPLEMAKLFEGAGLRRLHLVDLDGARYGKIANLSVLERIAKNTSLEIDFGGGIRSSEDISSILAAGASMAAVGSVAVKEPEVFRHWLETFGGEKILLGADVRDGKLAVNGWQVPTDVHIIPFLQDCQRIHVSQVFVTDITKDGLLQGPAVSLYRQILAECPEIKLVASGGVSSIEDIYELDKIGCTAVIVGKALYENKIDLKDIANGTLRTLRRTQDAG